MINSLIKDLESFTDIRYKMNRETEMCNHSYVLKIHNEEYIPAKKRLEDSIGLLLIHDKL